MLIQWNKSLETGISEIDEQHKQLILLFEFMSKSSDADDFVDHVNVLIDYAKNHFSFEEHLMEVSGFQDIENHKKAHLEFIHKCDEYIDDLDEGTFNPSKTSDFLFNWIVNHIVAHDIKKAAPVIRSYISTQN
ncbi:bacteriohemerythrin [Myxococcota bacterium]|nr:bacteriohemerythrin [Myxococcota bacterium]MBU1379870.1 bacteriohemerythrin [Myxococcota bacterium]MBU1496936.1 bacteriohemerythrin [Myxococcota bacterium]